ncbi:MFS transporter [Nonomuraea sp. B10E15]|uniref:MFS transporter n=1 Tax=unclassified Nonomuraea TaxID=2593643 RepID=UPI00325DDBA1
MSGQSRRVALATLVGTTVEWYDFFIYGTSAALVLNKLFFPEFSPTAGTLLAFATFATGWLARPIGGVLAGHFGDKLSRKTMLVVTVVGMGVATMLIGVLPTYASIGVAAPALLVALRVFQGLAVGGEYGGAVVMAVEHAPEGRRGLAASWPQMGVTAGLVLGTAVFYAFLTAMPEASFQAWGWRVPFLLSFVLVLVGLVIRMRIVESPAFENAKQTQAVVRLPLAEVVRRHPGRVVLLIAAHIAPNTYFYTFATFILAYATTTLGFSSSTVLVAVSVAALIETFTLPAFAHLSDRVGRRPVYIGGLAFLAACTFPFFWLAGQGSGPLLFAGIAVCMAVGHAAVYGTQASFFSELFPTSVRYTGLSLGYQVAGALFGGPLPLIATALVGVGDGGPWYFAGYMAFTAVISAVAAYLAPETSRLRIADARPATAAGEGDSAYAPSR